MTGIRLNTDHRQYWYTQVIFVTVINYLYSIDNEYKINSNSLCHFDFTFEKFSCNNSVRFGVLENNAPNY